MSLELSKEMLMVQGYLGDAKLLVDQQLGKIAPERVGGVVVEIAKMLQQERHHIHKKAPPTALTTQSSSPKTDQVMASARNNPQVPMMVSASDTEPAPRKSPRIRKPKEVAPRVRKTKKVEVKSVKKPRRR